jgi:hypothetical protein
MKPDFESCPAPSLGFQSSREQRWSVIQARRGRVEAVIESLLSDIQRRQPERGPQRRPVSPTQLELARLEAAHRLREEIEDDMQAFLNETDAPE